MGVHSRYSAVPLGAAWIAEAIPGSWRSKASRVLSLFLFSLSFSAFPSTSLFPLLRKWMFDPLYACGLSLSLTRSFSPLALLYSFFCVPVIKRVLGGRGDCAEG